MVKYVSFVIGVPITENESLCFSSAVGVTMVIAVWANVLVAKHNETVRTAVAIFILFSPLRFFCLSKYCARMRPNVAEPPPIRDANRDSGTDRANGGWLRLVRRHWTILCHIVSSEFCHRKVNPRASARTIRAALVHGVTSVGLVLLFVVSIKCPFLTSHVPVLRYIFVRSGWLNHDSSTKLPSAATVFVHRILCGIPTPCGRLSSSRNQTPANLSRKASSLSLVILS